MPVTGAKPKPDGQKVTRVQSAIDWIDVIDEPYSGDVPPVPRVGVATKRWWGVISSMPHCSLWSTADWQFAIDTALVHAAFMKGKLTAAAELRVREKILGTTLDARRDLRIRYVQSVVVEERTEEGVADFEAERRRRLMEAD